MAIVDGLCTLAEARATLEWVATDTSNDADLEKYISAATPLIEYRTGPMIARSRSFTVSGGVAALKLPVRFNTVTSVTVDGATVTGYVADPDAGLIYADGGSFGSGIRNVVVTVTVGYATIPYNVSLAARELVRHLWQQGRQGNRPAWGDDPASIAPSTYAMPNRVRDLLEPNPNLAGFA